MALEGIILQMSCLLSTTRILLLYLSELLFIRELVAVDIVILNLKNQSNNITLCKVLLLF